jgi:cell division septum initiation protein DivIVA
MCGGRADQLVTVIDMGAVQQATIPAPSFAVVRRGYDPGQVTKHLNRIDAEARILAADRIAAVEQATQLSQQLESVRSELEAAQADIERLRNELRIMSGPPDSVSSMNDRLQVMLRLAKDEFGGMRATAAAQAAAHAGEIIAAVSAEAGEMTGVAIDDSEWRGPQNEQEIERMRREAAEERARLDSAAATKRAEADEEFRVTLALRCREAMTQLARLQTEAMRSARQMIDGADEQARSVLAEARDAVRRTVDDAQREVDDLHSLRERLATQLDTSRKLLDRALPEPPAARTAVPERAAPAAESTRFGTDAPAHGRPGEPRHGSPSADPAHTPQAEPARPVVPAAQRTHITPPDPAHHAAAAVSPRVVPAEQPVAAAEAPGVPGPSRIPSEERAPDIAAPRRYP